MTRTSENVRLSTHDMAGMHGFTLGRTTRTNAGQLLLSASAKRRTNPDGQDNCLLEHCPSPVDAAPNNEMGPPPSTVTRGRGAATLQSARIFVVGFRR